MVNNQYTKSENSVKRILVVGDIIADVYREFSYWKRCPDLAETAVGLFKSERWIPGGAANVAMNIASLAPGLSVELFGVMSKELNMLWDHVACNCVYVDSHESLVKERIIMHNDQTDFVVRLDSRKQVDDIVANLVKTRLEQRLKHDPAPDLIVLSDYAGGILTDDLLDVLRPWFDRLLVDTKRVDLSCFAGSLMAKLNVAEYTRAVSYEQPHPEQYFKYFVVTRGAYGAKLHVSYDNSSEFKVSLSTKIEGHDVKTVDPCGCGDTFLAGLAVSLAKGNDVTTATKFANAAAASVVTKSYTAVANLEETLELLKEKNEISE